MGYGFRPPSLMAKYVHDKKTNIQLMLDTRVAHSVMATKWQRCEFVVGILVRAEKTFWERCSDVL